MTTDTEAPVMPVMLRMVVIDLADGFQVELHPGDDIYDKDLTPITLYEVRQALERKGVIRYRHHVVRDEGMIILGSAMRQLYPEGLPEQGEEAEPWEARHSTDQPAPMAALVTIYLGSVSRVMEIPNE